ncbi:MAG: hypothetical protein ACRD29_26875, partial [Acidimicrobiales bacterium]
MAYPDYREAVPILLRWLPRFENPENRELVVRALSVPFARLEALQPLIDEFPRATADGWTFGWAVGNALSVIADDSVFDQIVD